MGGWKCILCWFGLAAACANTTLEPDADPDHPVDAAASVDATPAIDAPPGIDAAGTGRYLDRCTGPGDCASGLCQEDLGGSRFCSRSCTVDNQCAFEHMCVDLVCRPDDTGRPCTVANPDVCQLMCLQAGDGAGACTRPCTSASECPAGYACHHVENTTTRICVDIEKPCASGDNCGSGLCITGDPAVGCTAFCDSAADCPGRLTDIGLPAYTCATAYGSAQPVCVVPADVIGSDPIGASCPEVGDVYCRSGICDTSAPTGAMCTQACTVQGGCGPGLGCFPLADGGEFYLVCNRGGSGDLGDPCTVGASCQSGLCDNSNPSDPRCTRFCDDGLCPTGWSCETVAGAGVSLCRP